MGSIHKIIILAIRGDNCHNFMVMSVKKCLWFCCYMLLISRINIIDNICLYRELLLAMPLNVWFGGHSI